MKKGRTVTEAKISNLDELTKVLSVKKEAQEQLLVVMQSYGIDKIVQNLKFKKIQGFTLGSLSVTLVIVHLWEKLLPVPSLIIFKDFAMYQIAHF